MLQRIESLKYTTANHAQTSSGIIEAYSGRYSPLSTSVVKWNPLDSLGLGIQSASYQKRTGREERD